MIRNIIKYFSIVFLIFICTCLIYMHKNPKIAVLCYHNIGTAEEKDKFPDENDWVITVENFREHLDYLKENNYKTLTMDEFYRWKCGEIDLPYKSVIITFDDGFLSNYEYAFPLLKEYNMNATVFVVGNFIDTSLDTEWNGNLKTYMSKNILLKLETEFPNIEVYSHSYNLHYQGAINQQENVLLDDIKKFDNFYKKTDVFCYPFGQYNISIETTLESSGYKMAFKYGPNKLDYKKASKKDNNFEIPRLNMSHGMSKFKFGLRLLMYK